MGSRGGSPREGVVRSGAELGSGVRTALRDDVAPDGDLANEGLRVSEVRRTGCGDKLFVDVPAVPAVDCVFFHSTSPKSQLLVDVAAVPASDCVSFRSASPTSSSLDELSIPRKRILDGLPTCDGLPTFIAALRPLSRLPLALSAG